MPNRKDIPPEAKLAAIMADMLIMPDKNRPRVSLIQPNPDTTLKNEKYPLYVNFWGLRDHKGPVGAFLGFFYNNTDDLAKKSDGIYVIGGRSGMFGRALAKRHSIPLARLYPSNGDEIPMHSPSPGNDTSAGKNLLVLQDTSTSATGAMAALDILSARSQRCAGVVFVESPGLPEVVEHFADRDVELRIVVPTHNILSSPLLDEQFKLRGNPEIVTAARQWHSARIGGRYPGIHG